MNTQAIPYATIVSLSTHIRERKISPVDIVETCLKRIEKLNPKLNAFITVLADEARQQAKIAEADIKAGNWRGPLHGIPVGVKDFYDTAGIKTTGGFEPLKDRIPAADAPVVTKLKEAGAIIIGKTNMHELGQGTTGLISFFGPVHNPWNTDYVAGGSSAGSAAAVASGLCFATVDTDAVGSTRIPAACCGAVGFKGSFGLVDTGGILAGTEDPGEMIHLLNCVGIVTRDVHDTTLVLDAIASHAPEVVATAKAVRQLRIAVASNFTASDEVRAIFDRAVQQLRDNGHEITEAQIPLEEVNFTSTTITGDRSSITDRLYQDIDILLTPTLADAVPSIAEAEAAGPQAVSPQNTFFSNYYALPAISIPCGLTSNGLPQGLQIIGPDKQDANVLRVAYECQQTLGWSDKHPLN
jgi:aspartyl-tRNA(Asn)/glutamyl-tRNA(Gln) amidotransferase subunit A